MRSVCGLLAVCGIAATANAGFFSFASDSNAANWTFTGAGAQINAAGGNVFQLLVNDDNGGNTLVYNVTMRASMTLANGQAVQRGVNRVAYTYDLVQGGVTFVDNATGNILLTASLSNGLVAAIGNGTVTPNGVTGARWGSTDTIQVNDDAGSAVYRWFGPDLPSYSLFSGSDSVGPDDLGFTLTVINTDGRRPLPASAPRGVALDSLTFLPTSEWVSEGSYSGSAYFVPTPGAAALMGVAGLFAARRQRRA